MSDSIIIALLEFTTHHIPYHFSSLPIARHQGVPWVSHKEWMYEALSLS